MRFIVIVAMYNMNDWITDNVKMLQDQSHSDFRCLIGDDLSTDASPRTVRDLIKDDPRFELVIHQEKKFSMGNICTLIQKAAPDDEDVIVLVDGDDKLAHKNTLQQLKEIYDQQGCWMTYGSYSGGQNTPDPMCRPYPTDVIENNLFRQVRWRASHLKTFKYKLWKRIKPDAFTISNEEFKQAQRRALFSGRIRTWLHWRKIKYTDLLNPSGAFIRRCDDKAMTFPMLEMAGPKSHFVSDILYIYNTYDKVLSYGSKNTSQKWYTRCIRHILKHKPKYSPITDS